MTAVTLAVGLAVGLAAGYAVGHGQGRTAAAPGEPPAPTGQAPGSGAPGTGAPASGAPETGAATASAASIGFLGLALTQDLGTCSVQAGHNLELGIPVTNLSSETVLLQSAKPVPGMYGMLKVLSWRWGPCGLDNDWIAPDTVALGPGQTTWVTTVVQPLIACPGPAPLQFQVTYSLNRQQSTSNLAGFPDLGAVRYSGCPVPAA